MDFKEAESLLNKYLGSSCCTLYSDIRGNNIISDAVKLVVLGRGIFPPFTNECIIIMLYLDCTEYYYHYYNHKNGFFLLEIENKYLPIYVDSYFHNNSYLENKFYLDNHFYSYNYMVEITAHFSFDIFKLYQKSIGENIKENVENNAIETRWEIIDL